jgi:hypothetical protein
MLNAKQQRQNARSLQFIGTENVAPVISFTVASHAEEKNCPVCKEIMVKNGEHDKCVNCGETETQ